MALTEDAARELVRRGVRLIGIDYLSIAPFTDPAPTHLALLEAGVVILEGLDLRRVQPGAYRLPACRCWSRALMAHRRARYCSLRSRVARARRGRDNDAAMSAETAQDVFESLIKGRRSIRRYEPRPVAQSTIDALLEAGSWAPSAHNRQPWRFAVLTEAAARETLARRMGDLLRSARLADGDDPADVEADARQVLRPDHRRAAGHRRVPDHGGHGYLPGPGAAARRST